MPEFKQYLGMNIKKEPTGIYLSQDDQINELISSFRLQDAYPTKSLLNPGIIINDAPDLTINIKEYQHGTGSLQYLAIKTRPDICRAACFLAKFNTAPTVMVPAQASAILPVLTAWLAETSQVLILI
jgi:hypothetical protein